VDWRVSLKCADWNFAARVAALNASPGGIFLNTTRPPAPGARVDLTLHLPDGKQMKLRGVVRHVVSPERALAESLTPGAGVKLDSEHELDLLLLEQKGSGPKRAPAKPAAKSSAPPVPSSSPPPRAPTITSPSPGPGARPSGPVAAAIGIDFGTTYTSAAVAIGERVHMIPDEQGRTLLPSLVGFPEGGGPQLVGWDVRDLWINDPRRVVNSAKRLVGRKFSDSKVAGRLHSMAYKTLRGVNDSIVVEMDGKTFSMIEISAKIMARAAEIAGSYLGSPVKQAVISVPVSFDEAQRDALRRAAQLAHLQTLDLVEEPVAGALAYGLGQQKNEIVAVYDFGGGTFDFSVLDMVGDHYRVLGTKGDSWLGGDDFDNALAEDTADEFWRKTQVELRRRVVEWQRLMMACEQTKRHLSEVTSSVLRVEQIVDSPKKTDLEKKVDRASFESLCRDLFDRSLVVCKEVLDQLGLAPTDMTQVVVIGGISRIPFVRQGVSQFFDRELVQVVHPEEAVALGAGLCAAQRINHEVRGVQAGDSSGS
jgi:molecular chaperone DnaK (HSP70)